MRGEKKEQGMNYICLDLEWNQAAYKIDEEEEIPFEVIEIGAVKLNDHMQIVGEFQRLIRPQVYPFLLRRTKEITGWTDRDLDEKGIYFEDACEEFLRWCGKDYIFCIWGSSDLTQLERNMSYFDIKIPWKFPLKYLDVQKLYALQEHEGKVRHALEHVIEKMEIPTDLHFHHAFDDARYTGMVLQRINLREYESYFSIDYYKVPKNRFEETMFRFDTYSKYISRAFPLKEELMENRRLREMPCQVCRHNLKKTVNWFSDGGRMYLALGECKEHGRMKGKIRIKETTDHQGYFGVRTIKPCSEEEWELILQKKENVTRKRRERRKKGSKKDAGQD